LHELSEQAGKGRQLLNTNLSKRALNALIRGGIQTLEEAAEWSDRDLLSLPNFGPASVACLRRLTGQRNSQ
jgi:DNA-directed RNA polymerase alpha subunit